MLDINLEWISEESFEIEKQDELTKAFLHNGMNLLKDCTFQVIENGLSNERKFFIHPSTETHQAINTLLEEGKDKEKRFLDLKQNFDDKKDKFLMSREDMEKVFGKNIRKKDKLFFAILDKLVDNIKLKTGNFIKEMKDIQTNLIKMRNSIFFSFYYKMSLYLYEDVIDSIYAYSNLIKCNKKNILEFSDIYIKLMQNLAHEVNLSVLEKIQSMEFFQKYKKEIIACLNFIEKNIQYYILTRYIGSNSHSFIFSSLESPVTTQSSEKTFSIIHDIIDQFPSIESLKDNLDEKTADREMIAMSLFRDFEIYSKFNHKKSYKLIYDFLLFND